MNGGSSFQWREEEIAYRGNVVQWAPGSTAGSTYSVGTLKRLLLVQPQLGDCFVGCRGDVLELLAGSTHFCLGF